MLSIAMGKDLSPSLAVDFPIVVWSYLSLNLPRKDTCLYLGIFLFQMKQSTAAYMLITSLRKHVKPFGIRPDSQVISSRGLEWMHKAIVDSFCKPWHLEIPLLQTALQAQLKFFPPNHPPRFSRNIEILCLTQSSQTGRGNNFNISKTIIKWACHKGQRMTYTSIINDDILIIDMYVPSNIASK